MIHFSYARPTGPAFPFTYNLQQKSTNGWFWEMKRAQVGGMMNAKVQGRCCHGCVCVSILLAIVLYQKGCPEDGPETTRAFEGFDFLAQSASRFIPAAYSQFYCLLSNRWITVGSQSVPSYCWLSLRKGVPFIEFGLVFHTSSSIRYVISLYWFF